MYLLESIYKSIVMKAWSRTETNPWCRNMLESLTKLSQYHYSLLPWADMQGMLGALSVHFEIQNPPFRVHSVISSPPRLLHLLINVHGMPSW